MFASALAKPRLPVAVIGGGPVGLVASTLLSKLKVPHRVYEQFPGTSIHPKACGLNQRSVELFRRLGIEEQFKKHRAPGKMIGKTGWFTGVGPNDREILVRDAWAGGKYAEAFKKQSPVEYSVLPQIRLEPILQQRALELNPGGVQYNSKVTDIEERSDHVSMTVQKRDGTTETVEAEYVLSADGGRGTAELLGIGWEGERDILDMITVHFKADIRNIHPNPEVFISWLINPQMNGSLGTGYLYHLGPYDRYNMSQDPADLGNEYVLAAPKLSDDPAQFDDRSTIARVRKSLGIPDLDVNVLSISHWLVNARVTQKYRSEKGRIFLVGDAAHRVPPWGALGLNSGLGDAHNLIWKLALALRSGKPQDFHALLDTYETERKPIATRVAKNSLNNMRNHAAVMDKALGVTTTNSTEENVANMEAFFDPSHPDYEKKRANVIEASKTTDHEFHACGIEFGWFYPTVDDEGQGGEFHGGQIKEDGSFDFTNYHPSTIPGHNLPHAWLQRGDTDVSTRDLVRDDIFVLLTGDATNWKAFQSNLMDIEVIGENGWIPKDETWRDLCGIEADGAILVRPDGIVAWRAMRWHENFKQTFPQKFAIALGKSG